MNLTTPVNTEQKKGRIYATFICDIACGAMKVGHMPVTVLRFVANKKQASSDCAWASMACEAVVTIGT